MTPTPILAAQAWRTNGHLIADAARLGYLPSPVCDLTHGEAGAFWSQHQPEELRRHDIDVDKAPDGALDATCTPYRTGAFPTVVVDGPYKLNGRATSTVDARYGVAGRYRSVEARHALLDAMLTEAARISSRIVLFKCQDQVNAGRIRWQTRIFTDRAEQLGYELVDRFDFLAHRAQPARSRCQVCDAPIMLRTTGAWGRVGGPENTRWVCGEPQLVHHPTPGLLVQDHAERAYSTLLVLERAKRSTVTACQGESEQDGSADASHRAPIASTQRSSLCSVS